MTTIHGMFAYTEAFNSDLSSWDIGRVTDLGFVFDHAMAIDTDISNW